MSSFQATSPPFTDQHNPSAPEISSPITPFRLPWILEQKPKKHHVIRTKSHRCEDRQTNLSAIPEASATLVTSESQPVAADVNGMEAGQGVRFS